jgi:hypothetical protein
LYLNPGSAGPKRFELPVTLAIMTMEVVHQEVKIKTEFIDLED